MRLKENHLSVISENSVKEICKPLFEASEISYFIFARFYDNGSHIAFPTNATWHQHFWKKGYQKNSAIRLMPGTNLWDTKKSLSQASLDAKTHFNIDHKMDFVVRGSNYYNVFGFASTSNNQKIIDFYLNNMDFLKKFMFYFMDKADPLIKEGEKKENRLFIEDSKFAHRSQCKNIITSMQEKLHLHINDFKFPDFSLSERQMQCLILLLRGRSAAETGRLLDISAKTVESHIEMIKNKLACNSKAELFDMARKVGIFDLIDLLYSKDGDFHV